MINTKFDRRVSSFIDDNSKRITKNKQMTDSLENKKKLINNQRDEELRMREKFYIENQ